MKRLAIVFALLIFAFGCTVGPNYKRPAVKIPDTYRGTADKESTSIADEQWSAVFQDPQLQEMIRVALQQNYDVRIAATRIEQARALLGITRADQFPTVSGNADVSKTRTQPFPGQPAIKYGTGGVGATANWNLDFWGKYRRATEAARADLVGSEWGHREVIRTLVADVARSYFELRELDLELEISQSTLASRQDSLKLIQTLADRGLRSEIDVRQAEQLVYGAGAIVVDLQRRIGQQENSISILLGQNPGDVARGQKLTEQAHLPEVPSGIPSSLLERRPDIQQAEQSLVAFNARIGVAKAAYFPQINLTASGGYRSNALSDLFTSPSGVWNFGVSLLQPIFEGGRLKSGVKFSEAQRDEALLTYQQTIQEAFREVSDALIAYQKNQEFRVQQEGLANSAQSSFDLSNQRYRSGVASYLEVLDSNTRLFAAQLGLAQAQLNELLALVDLYSALGGGWQEPPAAAQKSESSAALR